MNRTIDILQQLFAAYPTVQIGEHTIAVYMRRLAEIPPAELQVVVDRAIDTMKFPPTVAELKTAWHSLDLAGANTKRYSLPTYEDCERFILSEVGQLEDLYA